MSTDIVLREIDGMWQDEGFAPGPIREDVPGERRSLFQSYLDVVLVESTYSDRALFPNRWKAGCFAARW